MNLKYIGAVAALSMMASASFAGDYPEREVLGVVMWGAGGATDTVARAIIQLQKKHWASRLLF